MTERLGRSFAHIEDRLARACGQERRNSRIRDIFRKGADTEIRVSPALYLLHNELLAAALANDQENCRDLLAELRAGDWRAEPFAVRNFSPGAIGEHAYRRYSECLQVDPTSPTNVTAPDAEAAGHMRAAIGRALELLQASSRDHYSEAAAVMSEIVLVKNVTPEEDGFGGATSFSAWGAVFLGAEKDREVIETLQAIVHEAAHLVLFAAAVDGPLVRNDPEETFKSPLRSNPRPMDGIYHATFVSARMYQAVHDLHTRLSGEIEFGDTLVRAMAQNRQNFDDGYEVIREGGKLTDLGEALLDGTAEYMAATA